MFPTHGKIACRACFDTAPDDEAVPHPDWKMINDPGAWGGGQAPEYVVLGFSKGATQAGIYQSGRFESVAFAGMRTRLTQVLRAVGVLSSAETSEEKITNPESNIAFGSLIRCSVSRVDAKASAAAGKPVYACTGPLITKSFSEIPDVIDRCSQRFLTSLPISVKAVLLLGNSDGYVKGCQALLCRLFPEDFRQLNPMTVHAGGKHWIHLAHPSGLNGSFGEWLSSDEGPGIKRKEAQAGAASAGVGLSQHAQADTSLDSAPIAHQQRLIRHSVTRISAPGSRGEQAGELFVAKPDRSGRYVLNKKQPANAKHPTNMAVNKVYAATLDEAAELLMTGDYLINLSAPDGTRALRTCNKVRIERAESE